MRLSQVRPGPGDLPGFSIPAFGRSENPLRRALNTRILLEARATVDVVAEGGKTPTRLAIEADHAAIVDLLETAQNEQGRGA